MNTQSLVSLGRECTAGLVLLSAIAARERPNALSEVSECHRRASSLLADLHTELFRVFLPPLSRADMGCLGEGLHRISDAVFAAAMIAQHTPAALQKRCEELEGLCRLAKLLEEGISTLPSLAQGKHPPPPDTYLFYAEQNKVRAAHAKSVLYMEHSLNDRALGTALADVAHRLDDAHRSLIVLMLESV